MRKLSELIVLIRGGGEAGSSIAHRLYRSHFRVCMTEDESPLSINRGVCFSEAIYDSAKMVEDVVAERCQPKLDQIYRIWRNGNIPIAVDPELSLKPILKPDVLVNALMLNRETSTRITDAILVIGIGPGFIAGENVHLIVESNWSNNLGKVLIEGKAERPIVEDLTSRDAYKNDFIYSEDAGIFQTDKLIGDSVSEGEVIGLLNDSQLKAPNSGVIRGLLRNETKVLGNTALAEIDPSNDKEVCFTIRDKMRAIAGGVLEAILMSFNAE